MKSMGRGIELSQQIWKKQWPQDWKSSVFIPVLYDEKKKPFNFSFFGITGLGHRLGLLIL